ncbi:hypothetical protein [Streptomyces sp. NPDC056480]|uniref:hypothetical protein n=1 Tax=Streptomyces sp. NPDC056480 TaxID=3345833 RepID=UPI0036B28E4E
MAAPATGQRRTKAAVFLRALGSLLHLRADAPQGGCEVSDLAQSPESRLCGGSAELIVQYKDQRGRLLAIVHACTGHAESLQAMASTRLDVRAVIHAFPSS